MHAVSGVHQTPEFNAACLLAGSSIGADLLSLYSSCYSTRDTETRRLGSWVDQRYGERSNERVKYQSISPSIRPTPHHHTSH